MDILHLHRQFILVLLVLLISACSSTPEKRSETKLTPSEQALQTDISAALVQAAREQLGTPYIRGGQHPDQGFDCSGLVNWVYGLHGVQLPRTTGDLINEGDFVTNKKPQAGDLVFFNIIERSRPILHVGIATGNGTFIHSPRPGTTVREDMLLNPYWRQRLISVRRVTSTQ